MPSFTPPPWNQFNPVSATIPVQKDGESDFHNSNRKQPLSLLTSYLPIASQRSQNAQPDSTVQEVLANETDDET